MTVNVKLYGGLSKYNDNKEKATFELKNKSTVKDLIDKFGIPQDEVKLIVADGQYVKEKYKLEEGAEVSLIPVVAGG